MPKQIYHKEWFDSWFSSPYYEMLYAKRDEAEAHAFLQRLISWLNPKDGSYMLDVACGKGRYSKVLAEMGFDVVGIDLAEKSIREAQKMETTNLHFIVHDMRKPFLQNHFDYAFNFFTSFGYFKTKHDNSLAAKSMFDAVKKNGHVLIDFVNRNFAIQNIESKREEIVQHD